jgi:hypothetical protein
MYACHNLVKVGLIGDRGASDEDKGGSELLDFLCDLGCRVGGEVLRVYQRGYQGTLLLAGP